MSKRALEGIEIASPCNASWAAMVGDDKVRHCGECRLNVYNISAMGVEEAAALIDQHDGHLCVRLFRRADGTILTADCPVGMTAKRARATRVHRVKLAALASAVVAAGAAGSMAVTGARQPVMGGMAYGALALGQPQLKPQVVMGFMSRPWAGPEPAAHIMGYGTVVTNTDLGGMGSGKQRTQPPHG